VGEKGVWIDVAEGSAREEWTRTYDLAKGARLDVVNVDGSIEAFPASGAQAEVRVVREVRAHTDEAAQEMLKKITINEQISPDHVQIATTELRQFAGFMKSVRIEYRVGLPPGLNVSLRTQNGNVRLENVQGQITASATNGVVTGRRVAGAIDASLVNGGIVMDLASMSGDVRLVTVNGGIRLEVPADLNATLDASAVNGGISIGDEVPLEATERERARVSGRINKGGPRLQLQTTNGPIRIAVGGRARSEEGPVLHQRR
jgi:hypothetical protein